MAALTLHGGPEKEDEAWGGLRQKEPHGTCRGRRKRRFVAEEEKDATYWEKRRKNNQAAKLSRDKRRDSDHLLQKHLKALSMENQRLRAELTALNLHLTRPCAAPYPSLPRLAPQPATSPSPYGVPPMVPLPNLSTLQHPLPPLPPLAGLGFFLAPTTLLHRISYPPLLDLQGARTSWPGGFRGGGATSPRKPLVLLGPAPQAVSEDPQHRPRPLHLPGMHFYGSD